MASTYCFRQVFFKGRVSHIFRKVNKNPGFLGLSKVSKNTGSGIGYEHTLAFRVCSLLGGVGSRPNKACISTAPWELLPSVGTSAAGSEAAGEVQVR